jgi:hypothetical protein
VLLEHLATGEQRAELLATVPAGRGGPVPADAPCAVLTPELVRAYRLTDEQRAALAARAPSAGEPAAAAEVTGHQFIGQVPQVVCWRWPDEGTWEITSDGNVHRDYSWSSFQPPRSPLIDPNAHYYPPL